MKLTRSIAAPLFAAGALLLAVSPDKVAAQGQQIITNLNGSEVVDLTYPCTVSCGTTIARIENFMNGTPGENGFKNILVGGDFLTNPFQRGTSQAADITNTLTYGPDQWWFLGGASSAINWSQQTGASDKPAGFGASLRFQRKATNANTAAICTGQVLETKNSVRFQGQTAVLSFYALAGANFSAASSNVQVTIGYGTGSDQSAANFAAGSWTGYANAYQANTAISTAWTRYTVSAAIPATATQVGISLCYTPVGTAGTNDWIELEAAQLEVGPNSTGVASAFDQRPAAIELLMAQRYALVINEPAANVNIGMGYVDTGGLTCKVTIAFPDTMRSAPAVTFGGTALSGSTWKVASTATAVLSTPFLAVNGAHVPTNINLTATTTGQTAGQACALTGAGGGSKIIISSEL